MNFDNDRNRFQGFEPTPPNPDDNAAVPQNNSEPLFPHNWHERQPYRSEPVAYPGETQDVYDEIHRAPDWGSRWRGEARHDEWREPSYSIPRETTSGMYTPGICVTHPHTRNRAVEAEPVRESGERKQKRGGFLRSVCLVLVCVLLSGVASYGAMEYRFARGDFTIVNQVVLGGNNAGVPHGSGTTSPLGSVGSGMTAQEIYDMAVTQVVGIKIAAPSSGTLNPSGSTSTTSGSGFIISSDGYILTNYHVIEPAYLNDSHITVFFSDGREYDAEIIGFEASNDVALIKINETGLNPAIIANSDLVRVGQTVYAIGNPFGNLVYTMTDGIVSALDREVPVEGKIISAFQFSAAVNRGNSGGPVYDTNGEVLGIVTAKLIRNDVEGIGFAIPINDAIEIASGLIEHGYIAGRPLIGITAQTVSSGHAEYYGWVVGTYVRTVTPGSAAQKAGLAVGDIIIGIGENEVDSLESLRFAMRKFRAGDTASLTVWRSGEEIRLTITFDEDLAAGQPQRQLPPVEPETEEPAPEFPSPWRNPIFP